MKKTVFVVIMILIFMIIGTNAVFAWEYTHPKLPSPLDFTELTYTIVLRGYDSYWETIHFVWTGTSVERIRLVADPDENGKYLNFRIITGEPQFTWSRGRYYEGDSSKDVIINEVFDEGSYSNQSFSDNYDMEIVYSNFDVYDENNNLVYISDDVPDIQHLYGEGYNTNTGIVKNLYYNDIDFEVLIDETELWFRSNTNYQNLYLHVYEVEKFVIEGYEFINEYGELDDGEYNGSELRYLRTLNIGQLSKSEIFSIDINDIGMSRYTDGYVLLFSIDGRSLYDSWDPHPYYSYGEIWGDDYIKEYRINPSNELITDNDYCMFFFRYGQTGEYEYSPEPYIICPDENNYISGIFNLYWYNYSGYIQVINTTISKFYEEIDYNLIVDANDFKNEIKLWTSHDNYMNIPWTCTTEERELYGPITDYFPLKDGENIIEVYNSQSEDMSNKTLIYKFMVKYDTDEFIDINTNNGISNGTANAFNTMFRAVNETINLIDRASFGINSKEPGFLMELSSIPACDELLNDDIKAGLNFLKNQKIVLFEKEYIFYDLFTFVMTFIFGFVVIALFKTQILGIASTLKGNLTLPSKDVTRPTYRDKRRG